MKTSITEALDKKNLKKIEQRLNIAIGDIVIIHYKLKQFGKPALLRCFVDDILSHDVGSRRMSLYLLDSHREHERYGWIGDWFDNELFPLDEKMSIERLEEYPFWLKGDKENTIKYLGKHCSFRCERHHDPC